MSDYPMLISNKLHSFRNFVQANIGKKEGIWLSRFLLLLILIAAI